MMEGKRPLEDTSSCYDSALSNAASPHHYSPRLPTPEASRSSDSSQETSYSDTRRGPAVSDLLTFRPTLPELEHFRPAIFSKGRDMQEKVHDEINEAPQSPPYRINDDHKPLLPPLKMIISNAMNSPPETPRANGASLQPSPREPAIHPTSFKPLAFYPNKKARTESSRSNTSLPPFDTTHSRRYSSASTNRPCRSCAQHRYEASYCRHSEDSYWRPGSSGYSTQPADYSYNRPTSTERLPTSPGSDRAYDRDYYVSRQGSQPAQLPRYYPSITAPSNRDYWTPSNSATSDQAESYERRSYDQVRDHRRDIRDLQHCRDSYHSKATPFFVQPPFDYSSSKTRKRSNLPKASTEVMKTWFDNNIANPYPTEEQKATFSNLTGISMTQVSNWFINHRRRCPELREKRERGRSSGLPE